SLWGGFCHPTLRSPVLFEVACALLNARTAASRASSCETWRPGFSSLGPLFCLLQGRLALSAAGSGGSVARRRSGGRPSPG
ncbi:hypothetical protein M9458_050285, partial [Cirrhinus mrigala]